jgi:hypothetical protein
MVDALHTMTISAPTLKQAATTAAYLGLGMVGTATVSLGVLYVAQPIQPVVYELFYLQVGPSEATETAILTHFLVGGIVGLAAPMLVGDYFSDRGANLHALANTVAAMLGLLVVFLLVALAGIAAFLTALLVLAVGLVGVPLALRFRCGVRSGGVPAFVGGIPVIVLLLLLAGFGLGWGWGYVMTAQEVPASTVDGSVADFDDVPEIRDDLLVTGDCATTTDDRRRCYLYLRLYDHERTAARFMARHGVRCPYQNGESGTSDAFVAEDDGTYYRVTCTPHGD